MVFNSLAKENPITLGQIYLRILQKCLEVKIL